MSFNAVYVGFIALLAAGVAHAADTAAVNRGSDAFQDQCAICHTVVEGEGGDQGPALNGVVGRKAGTIPGFEYSKRFKASGKVWTVTNLDAFLSDPPTFIAGTKMPYNVGEAKERADIIAYLATTK